MTAPKSTLEKLRENEREARKDLIVDASIRLFGSRPYNQVGMRDIAAEAGMSAASIYRYFSDRDELFVEALARESKTIAGGFRRILEEAPNAPVQDIAGNFIGYLLEHDAFFQMMIHFMIDGGIRENSVDRFNRIEREFMDCFEEVFRKMGAQGNVRLIAHAFFASLNGLLITFRNYPGRSQEEGRRHMLRLADLIAGIFHRGVA